MEFRALHKAIGFELKKLENNPRYFVEAQLWSGDREINFKVGFYPETEAGKCWYEKYFKETKTALSLIEHVKSSINIFLEEKKQGFPELTISE